MFSTIRSSNIAAVFMAVAMATAASASPTVLGNAGIQSSAPQPDNTVNNKQQTPTADKQTNQTADRETARKIRKSVVADKSLSTYAHNIKIIVLNGGVTLKGPVNSEDEKKRIGDIASQVIGGSDKITNDITIKAGS